jgi:hypothetical protein
VQLVLNIPDDFIAPVKEKLAPAGVLEAVALDAVLGFLMKLAGDDEASSPY